MGQSMLPVSGGGFDLETGWAYTDPTNFFITYGSLNARVNSSGKFIIDTSNTDFFTEFPSWLADVKDGYVLLQWESNSRKVFLCGRLNEPVEWNSPNLGITITSTFSIVDGAIYVSHVSDSSKKSSAIGGRTTLAFIKLA